MKKTYKNPEISDLKVNLCGDVAEGLPAHGSTTKNPPASRKKQYDAWDDDEFDWDDEASEEEF